MLPTKPRDSAFLFDLTTPVRFILLAAFALRVFQLGAQSLWYDEAVSLFIAQKPIPDLIAHTASDIHPPLYYILLHFWLAVAGTSEFAAAFFSLFFGVLLVALGCRMARDWFGAYVGVVAAFLIAVSSFNLWYAQEVRMYTLVGCMALLSLMFLPTRFQISNRSP
ncbi:MAG: glycosyltransferase family 39 protein, partial [Chloroflexota bacterium]